MINNHVGDVKVTADGRPVRDITLVDGTGNVKATLWGALATRFDSDGDALHWQDTCQWRS